jgi:hypothetical protein
LRFDLGRLLEQPQRRLVAPGEALDAPGEAQRARVARLGAQRFGRQQLRACGIAAVENALGERYVC